MKSFTDEILNRLKSGARVSALEAARWPDCPSSKLTSRVSTLRSRGHKIIGVWIKSPNGRKYMSYSMKVTK